VWGGSAVWGAPSGGARVNLFGFVWTPMIRRAPAITAPWITDSPTPPRPKTTTEEPGSTFAVVSTAPIPVVTAQPSRHTVASGASFRIFASAISGTTVYVAKVEVPM